MVALPMTAIATLTMLTTMTITGPKNGPCGPAVAVPALTLYLKTPPVGPAVAVPALTLYLKTPPVGPAVAMPALMFRTMKPKNKCGLFRTTHEVGRQVRCPFV